MDTSDKMVLVGQTVPASREYIEYLYIYIILYI